MFRCDPRSHMFIPLHLNLWVHRVVPRVLATRNPSTMFLYRPSAFCSICLPCIAHIAYHLELVSLDEGHLMRERPLGSSSLAYLLQPKNKVVTRSPRSPRLIRVCNHLVTDLDRIPRPRPHIRARRGGQEGEGQSDLAQIPSPPRE
jgi:hypothetical protein